MVILVGVTVKTAPVHTVPVIALMDTTGFTVIVTVNVLPVQLPELVNGVME